MGYMKAITIIILVLLICYAVKEIVYMNTKRTIYIDNEQETSEIYYMGDRYVGHKTHYKPGHEPTTITYQIKLSPN